MSDVSLSVSLTGLDAIQAGFNQLGEQYQKLEQQIKAGTISMEKAKAEGLEMGRAFGNTLASNALPAVRDELMAATRWMQSFGESVTAGYKTFSGWIEGVATWKNALIAGGIAVAIKEIFGAAKEAEDAGLKLQGMMRATGGVAGVTAEQVSEFADAMMAATRFDDESIKNAAAALMLFGNVHEGVFFKAIKLASDYASLTGGDVVSATQLFGRALEDPEKGISLLNRATRAFSETQIEHIRQLAKAGAIYEAQVEILRILEGRIGGLSEQMNQGLGGALATTKKAWGEFLEALGQTGAFSGIAELALGRVSAALNFMGSGIEKVRSGWRFLTTSTQEELANQMAAEMKAEADRATARKNQDAQAAEREAARVKKQKEALTKQSEELAKWAQERSKQLDEAAERERKAAEKTAREVLEIQEKANAQHRKNAAEEWELDVKRGRMTTEEYIENLKIQLQFASHNEQERLQILQRIRRAEDDAMKKYIEGVKRQNDADEEAIKIKKEQSDSITQMAEHRVRELDRIIRLEGDERIEALRALGRQLYATYGVSASAAIGMLEKQIEATLTDAEKIDQGLRQLTQTSNTWIVGTFTSIRDGLATTIADVFKGTTSISDAVGNFLSNVKNSAIDMFSKGIANGVVDALRPVASEIQGLFDPILQVVGEFVKSVVSKLLEITGIKGVFNAVANSIAGALGMPTGGGSGGVVQSAAGSAIGNALGIPSISDVAGAVASYLGFGETAAATFAAEGFAGVSAAGAGAGLAGLSAFAGPAAMAGIVALGLFGGEDDSESPWNWKGHTAQNTGMSWPTFVRANKDKDPELKKFYAPTIYDPDYNEFYGFTPAAGYTPPFPDAKWVNSMDGGFWWMDPNSPNYSNFNLPSFATGGDFIASSPTALMVGETEPERVSVRRMAGDMGGSENGVTVNFNGPAVMDYYTSRRFIRDLERMRRR